MSVVTTLANKYRPRTLQDVCGNPAVVTILNSLFTRLGDSTASFPTGIILSGPRGVGKTSLARIIAAALNCESTSNIPCALCASCLDIYDQRSDAVIELDGAITHGVEDIRNLKSLARLSHFGKYRVVIIDEVQCVSPAGLSSLLKQLEEPPERTLYILATTDFEQIPATVASRCFVFQCFPLDSNSIVARLQQICAAEGFIYDHAALALIADLSDGSLRDAVMTLDKLSDRSISLENCREVYPFDRSKFTQDFLTSAALGDAVSGMQGIQYAFSQQHDATALLSALVGCLCDMAAGTQPRLRGYTNKLLQPILLRVWDLQMSMLAAKSNDIMPLKLFWYVLSSMLGVVLPEASIEISLPVVGTSNFTIPSITSLPRSEEEILQALL